MTTITMSRARYILMCLCGFVSGWLTNNIYGWIKNGRRPDRTTFVVVAAEPRWGFRSGTGGIAALGPELVLMGEVGVTKLQSVLRPYLLRVDALQVWGPLAAAC